MTRQFNVYSALVVPVPNETFEWVATSAEGSVEVSALAQSTWPLTGTSYSVPAGGTTSATAGPTAGVAASFQCNPPATDVTSQAIVIASQGFISFCSDVEVDPGDYFVWENTTSTAVVIKPNPENPNFWPLESEMHTVPPNGWVTVLVPENAEDGEYPLVLTLEGGGAACPDLANQPKIVIGSNTP
jgi:hypothetical protein